MSQLGLGSVLADRGAAFFRMGRSFIAKSCKLTESSSTSLDRSASKRGDVDLVTSTAVENVRADDENTDAVLELKIRVFNMLLMNLYGKITEALSEKTRKE